MKNLSVILIGILGTLLCLPGYSYAHPYQNPYDSYTPGSYNNYVREKNIATRNAKELERHHYQPSSTPKPYSTSTPSYFNAGAAAEEARRKKSKEDYDRRTAEKIATYNDAASRWKAEMLARGRARTAEDHYDLMLMGYRKGYDANVIHNVIGNNIAAYTAMYGKDGPAFKVTGGKEDQADDNLKLMAQSDDPRVKAYFFTKVIEAYPNAGNYGTMGVFKMQGYQYDEAAKNFKAALDLDNTNILFKSGYAAALAFADQLPAAELAYKDLLAVEPSSFSELNLAWVLMRQGKDGEALKHAETAGSIDPDEVGTMLVQAGLQPDVAKAKKLADEATAIRPDLGTGNIASRIFNYAKILHTGKDYLSSMLFLDLAVKADPKNADYVELRYGTNTLLLRHKLASVDAEMLEKL